MREVVDDETGKTVQKYDPKIPYNQIQGLDGKLRAAPRNPWENTPMNSFMRGLTNTKKLLTDPMGTIRDFGRYKSQRWNQQNMQGQGMQGMQGMPTNTAVCGVCGRDLRGTDPNMIVFDKENKLGQGINFPMCQDCAKRNNVSIETQPQAQPVGASFNLKDYKLSSVPINPLDLHPAFLKGFAEEEDVVEWILSLSDRELSIMLRNKDNPQALEQLRAIVVDDLNETAKQLAMEE